MPYVTCVPTCKTRASFSFLRANMPACNKRANVPKCQMCSNYSTWCANVSKVCQFFILACQRAKSPANFSNIPTTKCYVKFLYFIIIWNFYVILDIIVIQMICICIAHKNCIILHFYTSYHIKEKCVEFLFCETFLFFS